MVLLRTAVNLLVLFVSVILSKDGSMLKSTELWFVEFSFSRYVRTGLLRETLQIDESIIG